MFASSSRSNLAIRPVRRRLQRMTIAGLLVVSLSLAGCTDDKPELTDAQLLNELEGRELSAAELAEREQVAQTLCRLDDAVLIDVWDQLSVKQLAFQDFVFSRVCERRSQLYAEQTGRFAITGE